MNRQSARTQTFYFHWVKNGCKIDFSEDVQIPLSDPAEIAGVVSQIMKRQQIPCFAAPEFQSQLIMWLKDQTVEFYDDEACKALDVLQTKSENELETLVNSWCDTFAKDHKIYCVSEAVSTDQTFSTVYQSLLHSSQPGVVQQLLDMEQQLAVNIQKIIRERNWELERLKKEHASIIGEDKSLTSVATKHLQKIHLVETNYRGQLCSLMDAQKRNYRSFVLKLHENDETFHQGSSQNDSNHSSPEKSQTPVACRAQADSFAETGIREESFTIYLGAQLKTMHNLRLSALDPILLCKKRTGTMQSVLDDSRRLQMALNLYSNQLSGVVLLVDCKPNYHLNFNTEFYKACEQSSELHLNSLDNQLQEITQQVVRTNQWRHQQEERVRHSASGASLTDASSDQSCANGDDGLITENLRTGDVYVTRHSNLSQVHVVFHMVADPVLKTREINSRHPCITGLRNIIRLCSKFGVTNVSLPLLLIDKMNEELTVQWCLKRAELVFKCVKGFLMEGPAIGGTSSVNSNSGLHQNYTLQFMLPPEISAEVFSQLHDMLPTIYHLVNPVVME